MIQKVKTRSMFDKKYNYRLVLSSDNIDIKHCGNCVNLSGQKGLLRINRCYRMKQYGLSSGEIDVNVRRGLCDLHRRNE